MKKYRKASYEKDNLRIKKYEETKKEYEKSLEYNFEGNYFLSNMYNELNKETRKFYQKPLSVCPKCQGNYSKDKFIEGILYEAGGPWDEKYK